METQYPELKRIDSILIIEKNEVHENMLQRLSKSLKVVDEGLWREGYIFRIGIISYDCKYGLSIEKQDLQEDIIKTRLYIESLAVGINICKELDLAKILDALKEMSFHPNSQKSIIFIVAHPLTLKNVEKWSESEFIKKLGANVYFLTCDSVKPVIGYVIGCEEREIAVKLAEIYDIEKREAWIDERVLYAVSRLGLLLDDISRELELSRKQVFNSLRRLVSKWVLDEETIKRLKEGKKKVVGRRPTAVLLLPTGDAIQITDEGEHVFGREDFLRYLRKISGLLPYVNMISRKSGPHKGHFKIITRKVGDEYKHYIVDEGSTNGTYLNGVDIRGKGEIELKSGDEIFVGRVLRIRFIVR